MHSEPSRHGQAAFHGLTPPLILDLAEAALGLRCTNLCRPYNSYINRVYELADTAGRGLVIKFDRPGRWSRAGERIPQNRLNPCTLNLPVTVRPPSTA